MKTLMLWLALSAAGTGLIAQTGTTASKPQAQSKEKSVSPPPPAVRPAHTDSKAKVSETAKPEHPTAVHASTSTPSSVKKEAGQQGAVSKDKKAKKEKKEKKENHSEHMNDKVVPAGK